LQGKGKEKKNVCNEKWKRKLFAMKMKRKKCERTKCLQWKGKEEILQVTYIYKVSTKIKTVFSTKT
jgi:hypothetical protein